MRRLNPLIAILATLAVPLSMLLAAAPAMASASGTIYKECEQNGQITGNFSRAQLKSALNGLPSEVSEYSDCQDLIQQALLRKSSPGGNKTNSTKGHAAGAKGGGGGGSGKGSKGGKAGDSSTSKSGGRAGSGSAVTLAGSDIRPGSTGSSGSSSSLPVALIVVLILLALTAVSGGAVAIRRRVDTGQST